MSLSTIADFARGTCSFNDLGTLVNGVSTDTRSLQRGNLYVALEGERFNGHNFLREAVDAGCGGLMLHSPPPDEFAHIGVVRVEDTLTGLQQLARNFRKHLGCPVAAITGSNGKTSTKDMLATVLGEKYSINATKGNLNNHIGVPLSILATEESNNCLVIEMGMNHHGEIEVLADIAQPDLGIITNIGTAHIEFLGSRGAIADEKGCLAEALTTRGTLILNANDDFCDHLAAKCRGTVLRAGIDAGEITATRLVPTETGIDFLLTFPNHDPVPVSLPLPGRHMVNNAVLVAAAGFAFQIPPTAIAAALYRTTLTHGRLSFRNIGDVRIIDDSYNANPESMKAALDTLASLSTSGRRIALLGEMGELGDTAADAHREVGRRAAALNIDWLIACGTENAGLLAECAQSCGIRVDFVASPTEAARLLRGELKGGDLVLVKGSRSARMEQAIQALETQETQTDS